MTLFLLVKIHFFPVFLLTEEETHQAICQLGADKAPGPDGFPMCFYLTYWDILQSYILKLFQAFHKG